ncbi:MAG: hypothetical protein EOO09_14725 [Chitinophagaceae bacterium]|nr:MAG: hypothetical protein EOO09_14725 [Chitinophagaceae bacterium]
MNIGLLILLLLTLLILVFSYLRRARSRHALPIAPWDHQASETGLPPTYPDKESLPDLHPGHPDTLHQLVLAFHLCNLTIPVWNRYTGGHHPAWRNSTSSPWFRLDPHILERAHTAAGAIARDNEVNARQEVESVFRDFIEPVIALQDGAWPAGYPVKKCFLATYNLLKGILEKQDARASAAAFSLSITQSLDCLELSGLYTTEGLQDLLNEWKQEDSPGSPTKIHR